MRRPMLTLVTALFALGLLAGSEEAQSKIRVVASLPDLKALTEAVGGDFVEVDSLARGDQNAHDIEVRPSLMLRLRRADLLVRNGLGLDFWAEPLILGAHNPKILPGAAGYVDASRGVPVWGSRPGESIAPWATFTPKAIRTSPWTPSQRPSSPPTSSRGSGASPPSTRPCSRPAEGSFSSAFKRPSSAGRSWSPRSRERKW